MFVCHDHSSQGIEGQCPMLGSVGPRSSVDGSLILFSAGKDGT